MSSYDELLQKWPRKPERPIHYAALLAHPLNDDPMGAPDCYEGWEADHAPKPRFYVGGMRWFRNNVGLNPHALAEFRKDASRRLERLSEAGDINWRYVDACQDNPQQYWGDVARYQYNRASNEEPLIFTKAILILMTCEVAVERLLDDHVKLPNVNPVKVEKPEDIHQVMSIIPAGWRVNNFNDDLLAKMEVERPSFLADLASACGRNDGETQFLRDLAAGKTVQFTTATSVRDYCSANDVDLGDNPVKATPGRFGGRKEASRHERVLCG